MSESDEERNERFATAINRHGYGFANRVISLVKTLNDSGQCSWMFEVAEFPVSVGGHGTRIDFILRTRRGTRLMVVECKRVDPDYTEWLFTPTKFVRRVHDERCVAEFVGLKDGEFSAGAVAYKYPQKEDVFHYGIEVPTKKRQGTGGRDTIEEAASQVCRGMNGLVESLSQNEKLPGGNDGCVLFPVIFTTAKLFGANAPVSAIDLETGRIDYSKVQSTERGYVYYQYHLSPGIKHTARPQARYSELSPLLASEFIRTVAIVNGAHAEAFLSQFNPEDFDLRPMDLYD